ncbi:hypothetical protein T05_1957 [Trichinella murrelli]|uniref:Uncharacterized protein n=1 Tax=Trichinella murrelli TaxID=144512 RepID=A0A0V0UEZ2_9BILA|nr:hypothetical protein T05_1957 [Trichinella murrelli]
MSWLNNSHEPLPRAGSFASSIVLLVRSSLFGDGPVLTDGLPVLSASRFPDDIATIKQQTVTRNDDDVVPKTSSTTRHLPHIHVHPFYRTPPPIFKSNSSYGSFTFLLLRFLEE